MTAPISVISGVRQGCILPLIIFLTVENKVIRKTIRGERVLTGVSQNNWKDLDFADDTCLLSLPFFKT
jgi:hypothetical protein